VRPTKSRRFKAKENKRRQAQIDWQDAPFSLKRHTHWFGVARRLRGGLF
jgi:hypothetical protein